MKYRIHFFSESSIKAARVGHIGTYVGTGLRRGLAGKAPQTSIKIVPVLPDTDLALFGLSGIPSKARFGYHPDSQPLSALDPLLGEKWDIGEGLQTRYVTRVEVQVRKDMCLTVKGFMATFRGKLGSDYRASLMADINGAL